MTETQLFWTGVYKLSLLLACSILYRLGGWKKKQYRRIGVPLAIVAANLNLWAVGVALILFAVLSIGYGENSMLKKRLKTEVRVRLTVGILLAVAFSPLAFTNIYYYILHGFILIAGFTLVGLGLFRKVATLEEMIIGCLIGLGIFY